MANTKSAKLMIKKIKRNTDKNKKYKTEIKTLKKKAEEAVNSNAENKEDAVKIFIKRMDSAVSKGIYHKNTAARYKQRLAKRTKAITKAKT